MVKKRHTWSNKGKFGVCLDCGCERSKYSFNYKYFKGGKVYDKAPECVILEGKAKEKDTSKNKLGKAYVSCRQHPECRKVKGSGSFWEIKKCPWCGYEVSTSNIGKWCASCYCMFRIGDDGYVHFGKKIQKTTAEAWAIAIAKTGGAKIGGS